MLNKSIKKKSKYFHRLIIFEFYNICLKTTFKICLKGKNSKHGYEGSDIEEIVLTHPLFFCNVATLSCTCTYIHHWFEDTFASIH